MTSGGRRPLAASRAGTIVPAVAIVLALVGCSAPEYEVWRLPAEGASWQTCGLDRDGEERPASWCPSGRVVVATAADLPLDRHRIDATMPQGIVPDGPVVLVTESAAYDPQGLADTKTLLDGIIRSDPSTTLFRLGRALPQFRVRTRLVSRRLPTMPSGVTLRLPRGTTGEVGAWTVAAWPGGRARDVVVLRPTTVPAKSRLAISYGIARGGRVPDSPPVTFRVETTEGRALWGGRLDPRADGPGWRDVEIDLPDASGAALALRMIAEVDGPPGTFSYPVWGQPAVLVPHDAASGSRPNVLLLTAQPCCGARCAAPARPRPRVRAPRARRGSARTRPSVRP